MYDDEFESEEEQAWFESQCEYDDEDDVENICVECGEHGVTECDCCGAPLCVMHSECQANFCMSCSKHPEFDKMMMARYEGMGQDCV